ncbi:T9SS C-terminal target domain-containing protein [Patiriisocius marinistellae]|uniref:T9SS C-terminal target domain-containing protein n=1 Tax=Patiriisocius marinistellae TaxID=2494560 RepID=A0A5J4FWJ6_9FLAO|nr:T9SS type A sorting domain-containing protein [Patiriisocius marinistellae]GEQ86560.1 T9SS C-terminal target domain-containing protein [Patiriisocius marinistellae]
MKTLLLTAVSAIAVTSIATAQLSVSPNATTSTDSYIYASDVSIYVEGYVRLVENNNNSDTEASMYLRNQAQLLQGGSDNQNRGTGTISVHQDSNSDAYDYNLWASPVSVPVASFGNDRFGISRLYQSTGVTSANSAILKSGHNGVSNPLQISSRWFYRWAPASQGFVRVNSADIIPAGYGYIMKGTDITAGNVPETQNQNYDFRGRPNSGDISVALYPVGSNDEGNTLTGNPYPSALDLNAFFYDPANAGKFSMIQYYDEDRTINSHAHVDNKSGYSTWAPGPQSTIAPGQPGYNPGTYTVGVFQNFDSAGNPIGSTGVDAEQVDGRRMAPIAQGFFIKSLPSVTSQTTLTYKNSHRRFVKEAVDISEFKNQEGQSSISSNFESSHNPLGGNTIDPTNPEAAFFAPQIRINTYMGTSHMRQTVLMLHNDTTDGFDLGWDAISPMDATSEMYFAVMTPWHDRDPFPFVINSIPFDNISKQVPITFEIEEEMTVTVTGIEENDLPVDHIYVYDNLNDTYQEITGNNAASYLLQQGVYEDRFFIVFTKYEIGQASRGQTKGAEEGGKEAINFFQNNRQAQLEISNPEGYEIKSAAIFDMTGRLVLTQQNLGNNRNLQFPTGTFSNGVYLVVLTTDSDEIIDYKIIVENR